MRFGDLLALGGAWENYVSDPTDTASREKLIQDGMALVQEIAAKDHDAIGLLIDRAAESARQSNFFR